MLRVIPSLEITHQFDYHEEDWFMKVINQETVTDIVVTPPHYDKFTGENLVVSLLRNLLVKVKRYVMTLLILSTDICKWRICQMLLL